MSPETKPLRIAIVGGGIAGLSTALGVLKAKKNGANVELKVFEAAPKFAEIGAGVALGPNAQTALDLMGAEGALKAIAGGSEVEDENVWFDAYVGNKGENAGQYAGQVTGERAATGAVHRAELLDALVGKIDSEMCFFGHHCTSYTPHEGGVTLHFDTTQADVEADVIIASDGINSRLRAHMYKRQGMDVATQRSVYSEWVAWRGLIPHDKFTEAMGDKRASLMLFGKDKHILSFPVKLGKVVNIVAFVADRDHKKLGDHKTNWSEERPKSELMEDFADMDESCLALLKEIEKPSIWGIFRLPVLEVAVDGPVILIGDSAHAMTPHQGAGAGQAIEDALFISALLTSQSVAEAAPADRVRQVERALQIFHDARAPRYSRVQKTSDEAGLLYEYRGSEGNDAKAIVKNLQERMQWIWKYDVKAEVDAAVAKLVM